MHPALFPLLSGLFRFDPVRHAVPYPTSQMQMTGMREKVIIEKEDNFTQPGDRYRSWDPSRQERFRNRFLQMLLHPRVTKQVRRWKTVRKTLLRDVCVGSGWAIGQSAMPVSEPN